MFLCRCRFDVDLTDETGTVTASIFGELAEKLLTFSAAQAMDHFNQVPLLSLHCISDESMHFLKFSSRHLVPYSIYAIFQDIELQLDHVHESLKTKWFVAHIKPVQSQIADAKQRYTIIYCCEESQYQTDQNLITEGSGMVPLTCTNIESAETIVEGML